MRRAPAIDSGLALYASLRIVTPSGRSEGGFRLYTQPDIDRLLLIRRMKPLGFTLEEMAELLAVADAHAAAPSPATGEMPVVQAPQAATEPSRRARPAPRTPGERALSHATSMESCVEDLDQLLSSRREPLPGATGESAASRQAQVEAERARMQERLRRKVEEAKILREARTGEFAPVTEEVVDDSANLR